MLSVLISFFALLCSILILLSPESGTRQLTEKEIMQYIEKKQFPDVDIILLPPYIMGTKDPPTNYSALSVMRFAPFLRRMHIYQEEEKDASKNRFDYWNQHKSSRIIHFSDTLIDYVLNSPYLSEHFLILLPNYVLTNYCFSWQFFVTASHGYTAGLSTMVLKTCNTGLIAMTRSCFNECCYIFKRDTQLYVNCIRYAYQRAFHEGKLFFKHNQDHFISPCSSAPIKNTRKVTKFQEAEMEGLFHFEEKTKNREIPIRIVLSVIYDADHVLQKYLPEKYAENIQIWIYLFDKPNPVKRLSFLHQMLSMKNVFIEVDISKFPINTAENVGAYIMKEIKKFSENTEFKVLDVYSYPAVNPQGSLKNYYENLSNLIGNKLAKVYTSPFSLFLTEPEKIDTQEYARLSML